MRDIRVEVMYYPTEFDYDGQEVFNDDITEEEREDIRTQLESLLGYFSE